MEGCVGDVLGLSYATGPMLLVIGGGKGGDGADA